MENSIEFSNGVRVSKRIRSLDRKTLYNSSISKDTVNKKSFKRKNRSGNDSDKKSRKVVPISILDKPCNGTKVLQSLEDSNGLQKVSVDLAGRKRDFFGRKSKFLSYSVTPPGSPSVSSKCVSDNTDDRLLRPRRKQDWKGNVRKRRRFYEILFSDVDSDWLVNKEIKVFWPLDESWYHGFVDGYDGDKNLHHVKYDDRDEEWIDLQAERFRVLMFSTEIRGNKKRRCLGFIKGSHTSSKGEEKKKGKTEDDSNLVPCGLAGQRGNESLLESSDFPIVYYRRRLHTSKQETYRDLKQLHASKAPDPDVEFLPFGDSVLLELYCPWNDTEIFELYLTVKVVSLMNYSLMEDVNRLTRTAFLLHHGTLVTMWPRVCLEMIFLNNQDGLRYLIFEGCLMEVVQLILGILSAADHPNKKGHLQLPVFSLGIQGYCNSGFQRLLVFQLYSFHQADHSKWSNLEHNVRRNSLLVKQVSVSECKPNNMKALQKVVQKRSRNGISPGLISRGSSSVKVFPTSERNLVTDRGCGMIEPYLKSKCQNDGPIITSSSGQADLNNPPQRHETMTNSSATGITIQIPISDHCEDGTPQSSKSSLIKQLPHGWSNSNGNFLHTKKRRTQVSYSLPSEGSGSTNKGSLPNKRIRRSCTADVSKSAESSSCDANVLVTFGDRGWREYGAQIVLERIDNNNNNEWSLSAKISGITKYSHKVRQFLQPGATNRLTLAMMWKGGKDWTLEFPDRSQWYIFKEMHEECYDRNTRAALVRNIPIPGLRVIEKDRAESEFVRGSCTYYRQTETDVEMALDPLRVLYDMDSDDEQCRLRISEISENMFEKAMDMLEKTSYVRQCDHFTLVEIQELLAGVESLDAMKTIYEHWRIKRQKKGMALIRHLQPPLWEKYQREIKEWELVMNKGNNLVSSVSPMEKPAMFAFCFKPRGLEVKHRETKQRSQKNSCSPRDPGMLYHRNHRNKLQRIIEERKTTSGRLDACSSEWRSSNLLSYYKGSRCLDLEEVRNGKDISEEYRLRDAVDAARCACSLAKVKRDRAESLRCRADLAIQKAAAALMCAEAMKASLLDQSDNWSESSSEG